jgi:glycosyltransferase involved in cell wall biosynthesis
VNNTLRIVTPRYGAEVIGGTEALVRSMAHALSQRNWRISVWTSNAGDEATWQSAYAPGQSDDDGVLVCRFPVTKARNPRRFALLSRGFFRLPAWARPESTWLRLQGPYVPGLVKSLRNAEPVPTLFTPYLFYPTLAGLPAAPHPRLLMPAAHDERPFGLDAVSRAFDDADGLLFHTQEERELTLRRHPQTANLPAAVGSVGVEMTPPLNPGATEKYRPYIYFGGRSTPGKGIHTLLEGLRLARMSHPSLRLVVSGAAASDPAFAAGEGVERVGTVSDDMRNHLLHGAVGTVVPGVLESLSMLALESWACGRPCILNGESRVLAGQAERSQGALLFNDAAGLAGAIGKFCSEPSLADRLGKSGQQYVAQNYRWDAVAERIEKLIAAARNR